MLVRVAAWGTRFWLSEGSSVRLRVRSAWIGAVVLGALTFPSGSVAQTFPDHRAAAVDQYEEPTPTPTPSPTPGGGNQGSGAGGNPGGGNNGGGKPGGGNNRGGGKGASRGDDDDPSGLGIAPDSAGNPKPGGGGPAVAGDVVPLTDSKGGRLPFTGLDLLTVALLGCALIALGSLLALATRRRRSATPAA